MKTLYEGILKGMDDTIKSGESDIASASKDTIVDGITSNDGEKQKAAAKLFIDLLEGYYAKKHKTINGFKTNPYSWYVQFKKDSNSHWYDFVMIRKMGSYFYIVYIDEFGFKTKYDRTTTVKPAINYLSPRDSIIYEIDDTMPELDDMCDKILRIMYMR
jgi:hypothetical protein